MNGEHRRRVQSCVLGIIVLCCLLLLVAACKAGPAIVGKWEDEDGSTVQFYEEGTVTISEGAEIIAGEYTILNNNTLRIDFGGLYSLAGPLVLEYHVSGKHMSLVDPSGEVSELTRAK